MAAAFAPEGSLTFTRAYGLQSVGINTRFNLEDIFEIGQSEAYEIVENLPDVEVTMEKVLDARPLLYHLATQGATTGTLQGRSAQKCSVAVSIFGDTQDSASGRPQAEVYMSGLYYNACSYDFNTQGAFREQITLVGNHKQWLSVSSSGNYTFSGGFLNTDIPLAAEGVNFRQDFDMPNCLFPTQIPGISASGTNDKTAGVFGAHIQSVRVSTNPGRTDLFELGRRAPYFKFIPFPVDVRTDIEVLSQTGDNISAFEDGVYGSGNNILNATMYFRTTEGTKLNLGSKNKMSSSSMQGGNAGQQGSNQTVTYSFVNKSSISVVHPQDPTGALAG